MKLKLTILSVLLLVAGFFQVQAETVYTAEEKALIQDVLGKRISLRKAADANAAVSMVNGYISEMSSNSSYAKAQEEVKLVVDSMLCSAKYNCLYERNPKDAAIKVLIMGQFNTNDSFVTSNKNVEFNAWFHIANSEVVNSSLQFLTRAQAIKYGLQEKNDIDAVLKRNPNMSYALISAGLWYYFAPGIGGGSKSKGKSYFLKAAQNASNSYERYYANIYYSQCCLEDKNPEDCRKYLAVAESVIPGKRYIGFIEKLNASGYSLYDYISDSAKLDERVK